MMTSKIFFNRTRLAFLCMFFLMCSYTFGQVSPLPTLWYSTMAGSSNYTLDGSGNLSQWNSIGSITTSMSPSLRPLYVGSAINGKPAFNFNGASSLTMPGIGTGTGATASTMASFNIVMRTGSDVSAAQLIYSKSGGTTSPNVSSIAIYILSNQLVFVQQKQGVWINYAFASITANTNYVISCIYNSTAQLLEMYVNGALINSRQDTGSGTVTFPANATADIGSVVGQTVIEIGGTATLWNSTTPNYFKGMIAEFLYYDQHLETVAERKAIEDYLFTAYGFVNPSKCVSCLASGKRSIVWLKADAITTLANGASVTAELKDASGENYNAINNTAGNKPVFNTNVMNGRPAIGFAATSATTPRNLVLPTSNMLNTAGYTDVQHSYYFAINTGTDVTTRQVIYKEGSNTACIVVYIYNSVLYAFLYNNSTFHSEYHIAVTTNQSVLIEIDKGTPYWQVTFNGAYQGYAYQVNTLNYALNSTVSLGAADESQTRFNDGLFPTASGTDYFGFKGYVAEMLVLDQYSNPFERKVLENALILKYGIETASDSYRWQETHTYDMGGIGTDPASPTTSFNTSSCSDILQFKESNSSDGLFAMIAHDNGAKGALISGYNSPIVNAPQNVQRFTRTWRADVSTFPSTIGGTKTIDYSVTTGDIHPAAFQIPVLIIDSDGDFTSGARIYNMVYNGVTALYNIPGIVTHSGDYISIGYLNVAEFGSLSMNISGFGKNDGGYDLNSVSVWGLTFTAHNAIPADNFLMLATTSFITSALSSSPVPPGTTGVSANQTIKIRQYGNVGAIDIAFDPTLYPGGFTINPANDFVLMIDPTGAGSFTSASTYVSFVYEGGKYRIFGLTIPTGAMLGIASVTKAGPTDLVQTTNILKESLGQISSSTPIPMRLLGKAVQPYKVSTPCDKTVDKASINITFNTGDDYLFGAPSGTGAVSFTGQVIANISSRRSAGGAYVNIQSCTLTVSNLKPEQIYVYDASAEYAAYPYHDFQVTVASFTAPTTTAIKTACQLRADLVETSRIAVTTTPVSPVINQQALPITASTAYHFTWDTEFCDAPYYQFQLLRLYNTVNYATGTANDQDMRNASVDWSKALTLETTTKDITLTLTEGTGYYIWRVRPVGTFYSGGTANDQNWGVWSAPPSLPIPLTILSGAEITNTYKGMIFYYDQFDRDKNFIYNRNFTEDGKIHEGISYANGLQQSVQTQDKMPSNGTSGQVIVTESVYDYSGRPALHAIPAPDIATGNNYLGFRSMALQKSSKPYAALNFDKDANAIATDPLDNGLINLYYSDLNTGDPLVPNAENYAYARTLYDNDGLNRTIEQGAPGSKHLTGAGHSVRISYSAATDAELIRVFGDEAPKSSTVSKTITTDQNNISTVSYTDMSGKVIATCLLKNTLSNNMQDLATAATTYTISENLDNDSPIDNGVTATKPFVFTEPTTLHVELSITPSFVSSHCVSYCATCAYKAIIRVHNLTTDVITDQNISLASAMLTCPGGDGGAVPGGTAVPASMDISVVPGKYTVQKIITIDTSGASAYATAVTAQATLDLQTYATAMSVFLNASPPDITSLNAYMKSLYDAPPAGHTVTVQRANPLTPYTGGTLIDGDKVTIATSCCALTIPIMIPDVPLCDMLSATRPEAGVFADSLATRYEKAHASGWTWTLPHSTLLGSYTRPEFVTLISNMLDEQDPVTSDYIYTCQQIYDCWMGQVTKLSSGALTTHPTTVVDPTASTDSDNYDNQPGWATSSLVSSSASAGTPDIIQFLMCAGYHYKGYLNDLTTNASRLRTEAYKLFYYDRAVTTTHLAATTGETLCENNFCKMGSDGLQVSPCNLVMCPRQQIGVSDYLGLEYLTAITPSSVYTLLTETEYNQLHQCLLNQLYDAPGSPSTHETYDDQRAIMLARKQSMEDDCNGACDQKRDNFIAKLAAMYTKDGSGVYHNAAGEVVDYSNFCCTADKLVEYCKDQCYLSLNQIRCDASGLNASDPVKIISMGTKEEVNTLMAILYGDFQLEDASSSSVPCSTNYRKAEICYNAVGIYHLAALTDVDASPNLKNATVTSTSIITGGRTSTSKYISTSSGYAVCSSDDSRGIVKNVTVSAWVKKSSSSIGTQIIVDKMGSTQGFRLYLQDNFLYFDVKDNGTLRSSGPSIFTLPISTGLDANKWHFVSGVCRDTSVEVWIDGEFSTGYYLPSATVITDIGSTNSTNLTIGSTASSFDGLVDEVYVYACALGKGSLLEQYQATQLTDLIYQPEPSVSNSCVSSSTEPPSKIWDVSVSNKSVFVLNSMLTSADGSRQLVYGAQYVVSPYSQNDYIALIDKDKNVKELSSLGGSNSKITQVIPSADGNFIAVGEQYVSATVSNIYVVKLDEYGNVLWQNSTPNLSPFVTPSFSNLGLMGHLKVVEENNNVYVGAISAAVNSTNLVIYKFTEGTTTTSNVVLPIPTVASSKNYVSFACTTTDLFISTRVFPTVTTPQVYLAKISMSSLLLQWDKLLTNNVGNLTIDVLNNTTLIFRGSTISDNVQGRVNVGNPNAPDAYLLNLEADNGNVVWERAYGTADGGGTIFSSQKISDGQLLLAGTVPGSDNKDRALLVRIDNTGIIAQLQYYDPFITASINGGSRFVDVKPTQDGYVALEYIMEDYTPGNVEQRIVKLDYNFNIIWAQSFHDAPPSVIEDGLTSIGVFSNNTYVVSGITTGGPSSYSDRSSPNNGNPDYWFLNLGYQVPCGRQKVCITWQNTPKTIEIYDPQPVDNDQKSKVAAIIKTMIEDQLQQCTANNRSALYAEYNSKCKGNIIQSGKATYSMSAQHYTLYYYDRAGNLVKTVPPQGVTFLDVSDPLGNEMKRLVSTNHSLITKYRYNSLGQLVEQFSPGYLPVGASAKFIYNRMGMLRFSQNPKQQADQTYSYTKYDELGRVIEVGQASEVTTGKAFALLNDPVYLDGTGTYGTAFGTTSYPNTTTGLSQQTYTVYNTPAVQYNYLGCSQRYLRNRISYTFTNSVKNDKAVTAYSYDPHGNVEWLIQDVPGFSRNTIGYEYDLISNKVTKVKYNEDRADQLFHRYTYDADNRITGFSTSFNNYIWDNDARYSYFKHGPLRRQELGEDKVQGLDYTYNIHGWLKAVNSPTLATTDDPNQDSQSGNAYASDEFGFVLGYYSGDFNRMGSIFNNNSTNTLENSANQLFNGNISTWVSRVKAENTALNTDPTTQFTTTGLSFTYDYLNRIYSSKFTENPNWQVGVSTYAGKYNTSYTYDGNGNITALSRKGGSASVINNIGYNYNIVSGKLQDNKLISVSDPAASTSNTYNYDNIGNLNTDSGVNRTVKWTVYGKVDEVKQTTPNGSGPETETRFIYDASGNRIAKEDNIHPYTVGGVYQRLPENLNTTYYVRDVSGNIMATYSRWNSPKVSNPGYYDAVFYLNDQPLYGNSRAGEYKTSYTQMSAVELGRKTFQLSDVDNVQLDFNFIDKKSEYTNWITALATTYSATFSTTTNLMPSVSLQNINYTGSALATSAIAKIANFCGVAGSDVSIAESDDGASVLFYTVSMKTYWGKSDVLLLFDVDGLLMRNCGGINAGSGSRNVIVRVPGETKKYFLITRGTDKKLYSHTIDLTQVGNGTTTVPKGDVTSMNNLLDSKLYGSQLIALENRGTGISYIYATTSTTPTLPAIGLGTLNVSVFEVSTSGPVPIKAPTVMCANIISRQDLAESELKISPDGKKFAIYNHLQNAGWFGLQKSELILFNLGADYKVNANSAAQMIEVTGGWSLPRQSLDFSKDSRFVYMGAEHLSLTTSTTYTTPIAKEFSRYDIRDNVTTKLPFFKGVNGNIRRSRVLSTHVNDRSGGSLKSYIEDAVTAVTTESTALSFSLAANMSNTGLLPLQNHIRYTIPASVNQFSREVNKKLYELSDHLGNVTVTVSDMKYAAWTGSTLTGNTASVLSYSNYYPFGALVGGRNVAANNYRYGFNGKEMDNPGTAGGGSTYDYGFRIYNPQIARFLSVDPLTRSYPELTPYQFASNTPIWGVDWDGLEVRVYTSTKGITGHTFLTVGTDADLVVYSYGQYGKPKYEALGGYSTKGQGVLYRLTGERARNYVKQYVKYEEAKAFEIKDADEDKVKNNLDSKFNAGSIATEGKAKGDKDARVIDNNYDVLDCNCATTTGDAVKKGNSSLNFETKELRPVPFTDPLEVKDKVNTPAETEKYLENESKKTNSNVVNVTEDVKTEMK
ncbi:MAG: hypothetical protein JWO58_3119 [Chitinophagaceae bacterium]|nr:hypothetical protein [Chitinophagaceae bacterium]